MIYFISNLFSFKPFCISFGYCIWADHTDKQISEIMKIADTEMYHNKSDYYKKSGLDRRR